MFLLLDQHSACGSSYCSSAQDQVDSNSSSGDGGGRNGGSGINLNSVQVHANGAGHMTAHMSTFANDRTKPRRLFVGLCCRTGIPCCEEDIISPAVCAALYLQQNNLGKRDECSLHSLHRVSTDGVVATVGRGEGPNSQSMLYLGTGGGLTAIVDTGQLFIMQISTLQGFLLLLLY